MPEARTALTVVHTRGALRTVEEHLGAVLTDVGPLAPAAVELDDALDLVCAERVVSGIALPRFDNSAMDGYAVRRADLEGAAVGAPVRLPVAGEIGAGKPGPTQLAPGTAAKIMTGAPVPAGADAVVPYEWTDRGTDEVWIERTPGERQHVRGAGDDVVEGELLLTEGTVLGPRHLGLLASVGRARVVVRPRPRVAVLSTGSELRDPGEELGPDSIYDGNSYLLAAAVRRAGGVPVRVGGVVDDDDAFLAVLRGILDGSEAGAVDAVVTSGGISMGDFDVVKSALRGTPGAAPLGEVWFGGVAMQPGKPQGFGLLRRDAGAGADVGVPFFAVPGNPVSAYLSFDMFVRPALRTMLGRTPVSRTPVSARLAEGLDSPAGRRQLMRAVLTPGAEPGTWEAVPVGGPGSHLLGDLALSDALIVVPEDVTRVEAGESVAVIRLDTDD